MFCDLLSEQSEEVQRRTHRSSSHVPCKSLYGTCEAKFPKKIQTQAVKHAGCVDVIGVTLIQSECRRDSSAILRRWAVSKIGRLPIFPRNPQRDYTHCMSERRF